MRKRQGRRLAGLVTAGLLAITTWAIAGVAEATDVQPVLVEGNATCGELGDSVDVPGWTEFHKVEPVESGSFTAGELTVGWTVRETTEGPVFDWTSNFDIHGVFAKGGSTGGYLYAYPAGATTDEGLHAPLNPSGNWAALSHISFCYNPTLATTTSTTEESTSTTEESTSTTEESTSTTEQVTEEEDETQEEDEEDTVSASTETTARLEVLETTVTAPSSTISATAETLPTTGFGLEETGGIAFALLTLGALILLAYGYRPIDGAKYRGHHRRLSRGVLQRVL